jgi:hypothetical protein
MTSIIHVSPPFNRARRSGCKFNLNAESSPEEIL